MWFRFSDKQFDKLSWLLLPTNSLLKRALESSGGRDQREREREKLVSTFIGLRDTGLDLLSSSSSLIMIITLIINKLVTKLSPQSFVFEVSTNEVQVMLRELLPILSIYFS